MQFVIEVRDVDHLSSLLEGLRADAMVISAERA
jgi:hypothetical protein